MLYQFVCAPALCWSNVLCDLSCLASESRGSFWLRHLIVELCSLFCISCVTFQVSEPYRTVAFTLEEKMHSLVLMDIDDAFQTSLRIVKVFFLLWLWWSSPAKWRYRHRSLSSCPFNLIWPCSLLYSLHHFGSSLFFLCSSWGWTSLPTILAWIYCSVWERKHKSFIRQKIDNQMNDEITGVANNLNELVCIFEKCLNFPLNRRGRFHEMRT